MKSSGFSFSWGEGRDEGELGTDLIWHPHLRTTLEINKLDKPPRQMQTYLCELRIHILSNLAHRDIHPRPAGLV